MNPQQRYIEDVLLERAADQWLEDGVVDLGVQMELASEGYLLSNINHDIRRVLRERRGSD